MQKATHYLYISDSLQTWSTHTCVCLPKTLLAKIRNLILLVVSAKMEISHSLHA